MRDETSERQQADFVQYKNGACLAEHNLPINKDHWDPTKGRDQRGEWLIGDNCGLAPGVR